MILDVLYYASLHGQEEPCRDWPLSIFITMSIQTPHAGKKMFKVTDVTRDTVKNSVPTLWNDQTTLSLHYEQHHKAMAIFTDR